MRSAFINLWAAVLFQKMPIGTCVWPITATAAFFGLALIEYPLGKPRRLLSLIYATVALAMQIGIYTISVMLPDPRNKVFVKPVVDFIMFCCCFNIVASISLTHWHGKRYHKCLERFKEVDGTLTALGVETDYSRLRRIGLVSLITLAIMCIIPNTINAIKYKRKFPGIRYVLPAMFIYMPLHFRMLVTMQFLSVLGYAGTRFDCISDALKKFMIDDDNWASRFRNSKMISVRGVFVPDERDRRITWTVVRLYFQLCEILRDINTVVETKMYLQMGFDCVFLLCQIIFIFRLLLLPFDGYRSVVVSLYCLFTLPYVAEVIVTNCLCESVGAKARSVSDMAVRLLGCLADEEMHKDISFIVLQAKLRPLRFSCHGLCYFGYQFTYKIFSAIVRNAVIILQLKTGLQ